MVGIHPCVCPSILSVQIISNWYLNYSSYCFHVGTVNLTEWPLDLISILSQSLHWFLAICWPLICRLVYAHYLNIHWLYCFHNETVNSVSVSDNPLAYHHTPVILHQMLASNWQIGLHLLSPQPLTYCFCIWTVNSLQWVSQLISVPSCSSDFLLPQTKSCTQLGTLPHRMLV